MNLLFRNLTWPRAQGPGNTHRAVKRMGLLPRDGKGLEGQGSSTDASSQWGWGSGARVEAST